MLGSTQTVDMETTRKSNFGRVLVAVLNPSLIPKELDVVIADHYFELQFEVEKWGFDENGEEAAILWNGGSVEGGSVEEGERSTRGWQKSRKKMRAARRMSRWGSLAARTQPRFCPGKSKCSICLGRSLNPS
jgi:hypothetical protein